ncbi:hypothetical protein [Methylomonas koyamae]|uniref:hypothetical protein n=1 Tax=Methylomonas koyamae TaxID=702114 RepID=UPI001C339BF1|nr:hypothetical protein [Methylomonas koyamae]BBL57423.1 hypothetical protein MKFW12EY_10360 [Methylomonas koyamae]
MKNMTWRHCLILALAFWPAANQASTLSATNDIQIYPGGNIDLQTGQTPGNLEAKQPPLITGGDIQILPREGIKIQTGQTPINSGLISPLTIVLPTEPTFLAVQQASGFTQIGDHFDIQVLALVPFANASADELLLGFGFNTQVGGTGSAQFLGSSINPLFTDISTQDGVNLAAAGLAFPGLGANEVGSLISLAVMHFQAIAVGDLNVAITSDLYDLNQGLIFLNQGQLAINASVGFNITAVPLPPSLLLFLSGLGGIRRRRG